jgi:hypothetical protein
MAATKNLVAVTPGGDITEDMLAGEYLWYSIPEDMLSLASVRRHVQALGLDLDRFPKERRMEHVAQEACRKVEGVYQNGTRTEIRAEMVLRNNTEMVYQITKHIADKEKRVVDHPKALRVIFSYEKQTLKFEPLGETERHEVKTIEEAIREHFEKNATKMPGHKLRTIIRHYLEDIGAENVRGQSGGIYFVPKVNPQKDGSVIDGREFVGALLALLEAIYKRRPEAHRVPCVNDEGQREYLKQVFIENCADDLEKYRDELLDLVRAQQDGKRKRGFRRDVVARLVEHRKVIDARRAQFADLLQDELGELDRNMKLADAALKKFLTEADVED